MSLPTYRPLRIALVSEHASPVHGLGSVLQLVSRGAAPMLGTAPAAAEARA